MTNKLPELPIPVLQHPHWRVNFRPNEYKEDLVTSLSECYNIIERNKLSLRGWDYPHLSGKTTERGQGNNWVASWSDFMENYQYWRFYQSGQFLHLFSVREVTEDEGKWKEKLLSDLQSHLFRHQDISWKDIPGFISITNFIYNVTEIFEFAARLCQSQVYTGTLTIKIDIKGIKDFALSAPVQHIMHYYYATSENVLSKTIEVNTEQLIAASQDISLSSIVWFFERFGWMSPSEDVIRYDQENLLKGRF